MTSVPRLSVGLPVYNGEQYLVEALDALLRQSYEDFELIISDNASTDGTEEICRRYLATDRRIRYIRQPRNIGAAPNHNFVFRQVRGELFKWASHDDLYGQDLLLRCVEALDEYPDVVLSHAHMAIIDGAGKVIQRYHYSLATDSPHAPERFRSLLFTYGGDDFYGVIRSDVLRRVTPHGSYHNAGRQFVAEIALHGPFYQVPELLYFRRDHPDRGDRNPTIRAVCANLDLRRADRLRHPTVRLLGEYVWGYVAAIRHAPLSPGDRLRCYGHLAPWLLSRAFPGSSQRIEDQVSPVHDQDTTNVDTVVAGPGEGVFLISSGLPKKRKRTTEATPRVGFFGLLGSGNIGNDGSLESMLAFLRTSHPDAELGAMCSGPEQVTTRYGIPATPMRWYQRYEETTSGAMALTLKAVGRLFDTLRTVRRFDGSTS